MYQLLCYSILIVIYLVYQYIRWRSYYSISENILINIGSIILFVLLLLLSVFYFDIHSLVIKPDLLNKYGLLGYNYNISWYTLITSNYIHSDYTHLFFNIIALIIISSIEDTCGSIVFLLMFIFPSILSSLIIMIILPDNSIALGASTGISSLYSIIVAENLLIDNLPVSLPTSSKIQEFILGIGMIFIVTFLLSFGRTSLPTNNNILPFSFHLIGATMGYLLYVMIKYLFPNTFKYLVIWGNGNGA